MIWSAFISTPFSLNDAYANRKAGGRTKAPAYRRWIRQTEAEIMSQGRRPTFASASMLIIVDPAALRQKQDLDNLVKPIVDRLVSLGVLPDDRWERLPDQRIRVARPGEELRAAIEVYLRGDEI